MKDVVDRYGKVKLPKLKFGRQRLNPKERSFIGGGGGVLRQDLYPFQLVPPITFPALPGQPQS